MALSPFSALGVAAVNLSSGYYNAHTQHEYINKKQLDTVVQKVIGIPFLCISLTLCAPTPPVSSSQVNRSQGFTSDFL